MNRRTYQRTYQRLLKRYTKANTRNLQRVFKDWMQAVNWEMVTEDNYGELFGQAMDLEPLINAYDKLYYTVGISHGKRVGQAFNKDLKTFTVRNFITLFELNYRVFLQEFGMLRIVTVRQTFWDTMTKLMLRFLADGMDTVQASQEILKIVKSPNFYFWQAERIARTESGAAANYGATLAGQSSGFVMVKEWISTPGPRTRRIPRDEFDHVELNGVQVEQDARFNVQGEFLRFPCDPEGAAANVIQCRCAVAIVPKRDRDGKLIRKN